MRTPVLSRLLLVEWLDSTQPEHAWLWLNAEDVHPVARARSVGWLLEQPDPAVLVLCPTVSLPDADGDRQALGLLRIPACSVTARWDLADPAAAPATGETA